MSLKSQITEDMKTAMRAKDATRLGAIRLLLSAMKQREVDERIELTNGLVIFLQEDHELPFINGSILIRGGSRDEPVAKLGLISLYGETWRTSGTATISPTRPAIFLRWTSGDTPSGNSFRNAIVAR